MSKSRHHISKRRAAAAAKRERLLEAFEGSGLSAVQFARRHRLNYTTFCGWRQRRDRAKEMPSFVQVEVAPPAVPVGSNSNSRVKSPWRCGFLTNSTGARVSEGCLAAPGLLAQLLVGKYADHLPFYRQQMMFWQRYGVFMARQQMVLWTGQCVSLLEAIAVCIKKEVRQSPYVQVDETPVKYLDPQQPGRCAQGYLWTALVPGKCVVYEWHASRAAGCLDLLLGPEYQGKLQCDGYSAYPAYARDKAGIKLFGCLAHARRGFFEAKEQAPTVAGWILNQMRILYGWEEQLRQNRAGPGGREALRASHSRMVMERLKRALEKLASRYLPKSPMGQLEESPPKIPPPSRLTSTGTRRAQHIPRPHHEAVK